MKQFLLVIFIFGLILFGGVWWWKNNSQPASPDKDLVSFVIPRGTSAVAIGNKLKSASLIKNPLAFKIYVQLTGKQKSIQAGEYRLTGSYSLSKLVSMLVSGPEEVWVTIPEGLRKEEIAERFIAVLGKKGQEAEDFRTEFLSLTKDKEGYLFPDTYLFAPASTAQSVVNRMLALFEKQVDSEIRKSITESEYSFEEVIILASLLERETKSVEEKPTVAGIIYKRLEADWPLQIDASVQYAVANQKLKTQLSSEIKYWEGLSKDNLAISSPYNLYKLRGLPPTPVCNPGLITIKAAANPTDSDYWFYIHDKEGKIHYASIIEEHNLNVAKYLR
jgi:UPF0755 protein